MLTLRGEAKEFQAAADETAAKARRIARREGELQKELRRGNSIKLDSKLQGQVDSQQEETRKVERRVLEAVSSLNNRVEGNSITISSFTGDLKKTRTNLSMIKTAPLLL